MFRVKNMNCCVYMPNILPTVTHHIKIFSYPCFAKFVFFFFDFEINNFLKLITQLLQDFTATEFKHQFATLTWKTHPNTPMQASTSFSENIYKHKKVPVINHPLELTSEFSLLGCCICPSFQFVKIGG